MVIVRKKLKETFRTITLQDFFNILKKENNCCSHGGYSAKNGMTVEMDAVTVTIKNGYLGLGESRQDIRIYFPLRSISRIVVEEDSRDPEDTAYLVYLKDGSNIVLAF